MGALFQVLISFLASSLSWIFSKSVIQFVLFGFLYFIFQNVLPYFFSGVSSLLPSTSPLNSSLSGISPQLWFFFDYFRLDVGLPAIISAYSTRFFIRRLPIIG